MPFTAFHCAPVWLLFLFRPKRFDWIGLSVGAVLPDILEPLMILFFIEDYGKVRLWTHSLIGASTILLFFSVVISLFLIPRIMETLRNKYPDKRFYTFGGIDVQKKRDSFVVIVYSALIGTTSHVTLDLLYHTRNPVFYPYGNFALLLFNDIIISKIITTIVTGGIFCFLAYRYWWKV